MHHCFALLCTPPPAPSCRLKADNLCVSPLFLISRFLLSLIYVFPLCNFVQRRLYLSHPEHVEPICMRPNCHDCVSFVCVRADACCEPAALTSAPQEYLVFGWLHPAPAPNNRLLIRCVNLPLLLFCFLQAPPHFCYCSVARRCGKHC